MKGEPDESFKWYKDKEGLEDKRFPRPISLSLAPLPAEVVDILSFWPPAPPTYSMLSSRVLLRCVAALIFIFICSSFEKRNLLF